MTSEFLPDKDDIPIILRGNIKGLLVIKSSDLKKSVFTIYYMLSDGKLLLKDSKTIIGSRSVDIKGGDIICLWANHETGYEEFCGWLNESGDTIQIGNSTHVIPDRLRKRIQEWCKTRNLV